MKRNQPQQLSAKEYRDRYVTKVPEIQKPTPIRGTWKNEEKKTTMTAEEWRDYMKKKSRKPQEKNKGEIRLLLQLARIAFVEEYRFHKTRRWRFDFAIPERKIAIEYEGIHSKKSRHTTVTGYTKDAEKYNAAAKEGWTVLRYTAKTYTEVINDINEIKYRQL